MVTTWTNVLNGAATTVGATPGDAVPATALADVLQISNSGTGIDTTLRDVGDGDGTTVPLKVSTSAVMLPNAAIWPYGDSTFFSSGQTGILIPYYIYPNNPYSDTTCTRLLGLIRQYRGRVPVIVIVNPNSGPGSVMDGNWGAFIKLCQAAGAKVAGYVATGYAVTAEAVVKASVDTWLTLYADTPVDTIFFDEQTYDLGTNNANVALYKRYTDYCHARNLAPVICNPGVNQREEYFAERTGDIIVVAETGTWPSESDMLGGYIGGHIDYKPSLRAALVYGQSSVTASNIRTLARYVQWIYATDDALSPNPWDSLATHLEDQFAALAGPNSTDATLLARANHTGTQLVTTISNLSAGTITATGGTTARALADLTAETVNVKSFGATGDGTTDDTTAIKAAMDYALAYIQARSRGGIKVTIPPGRYVITNELLSDAFQTAWWAQTSLGAGKYLVVEGAGSGSTLLLVTSSWLSGVRNSTNGNQRAFGPWSGTASPSCIWPIIAPRSPTPAAFSLRGIRMEGTARPGRDPIPLLVMSELGARHADLFVSGFDACADVLMGSFNSVRTGMHFSGNGHNPVQSGAVLGNSAGYPPPWIGCDISGTTVTAKAKAAAGGYAIGDALPLFYTRHIGKTIVLDRAASHSSVAQPLQVTITAVGGEGVSTATVSLPAGVSIYGGSVTSATTSFLPVQFTSTADSAVITLSDPVKIGRGAADMVGMFVMLPKAGSKTVTSYDVLFSRILSCDVGNDTDGYTQITLFNQARFAATDLFMASCCHISANEDTILAGHSNWATDDTDFITCRWEQAGGSGTDVSAAAPQFFSQGAGEAVQYVACKIHGDSTGGQFGAEGQAIIDAADSVQFIGTDFTHFSETGTGAIRFVGWRAIVSFSGCAVGGWQLPHNYIAMYADPMSGYSLDNWSIMARDFVVKNDTFPVFSQKLFGGQAGMTNYRIAEIFADRERRASSILLTSTDDLDLVKMPGSYYWASSTPSNGTLFGGNCSLIVAGATSGVHQILSDHDNVFRFERDYFGSWTPWRSQMIRSASGASFASAANNINTSGKILGTLGYNSTTLKIMMALGPLATDAWQPADGSASITPV